MNRRKLDGYSRINQDTGKSARGFLSAKRTFLQTWGVLDCGRRLERRGCVVVCRRVMLNLWPGKASSNVSVAKRGIADRVV